MPYCVLCPAVLCHAAVPCRCLPRLSGEPLDLDKAQQVLTPTRALCCALLSCSLLCRYLPRLSGQPLDLDKERQVRTPEEMAVEAAELRAAWEAQGWGA